MCDIWWHYFLIEKREQSFSRTWQMNLPNGKSLSVRKTGSSNVRGSCLRNMPLLQGQDLTNRSGMRYRFSSPQSFNFNHFLHSTSQNTSISLSVSKTAAKHTAGGFKKTRGSLDQHSQPSQAADRHPQCRECDCTRPGPHTGKTSPQYLEKCWVWPGKREGEVQCSQQ